MKILCLSDKLVPFIYGPQARQRFQGVDLIIGCGDLHYYYLEYVLTTLNVPLFYVRGNHDVVVEYSPEGHQRTHPHGGADLHRHVLRWNDLILAGVEGCLRYRSGQFQYTQKQMWRYALGLAPRLMANRLVYGRYLDVLVTHAPPLGVHDQTDAPHRGINAFAWLARTFKPSLYIHGHIHRYRPDDPVETRLGDTRVVNAFGFQEIDL